MISALKIPEIRKPVLIGEKGIIKNRIESKTNTILRIEDDVEVQGEAIDVMVSKQIIKAIGRGFSPETAFELLDENKMLHIIDICERKSLKRIKARLIGTGGKARRNIEMLSQTSISIYGKTVSIIGEYENLDKAINAINKIIDGAPHRNAYRLLEKGSKMVV